MFAPHLARFVVVSPHSFQVDADALVYALEKTFLLSLLGKILRKSPRGFRDWINRVASVVVALTALEDTRDRKRFD